MQHVSEFKEFRATSKANPIACVTAVGRKRLVAKVKASQKPGRVRNMRAGRLNGIKLLGHVCEIMDLFPVVSDKAAGELAERMMLERLRREEAERSSRYESTKTGRRKKR